MEKQSHNQPQSTGLATAYEPAEHHENNEPVPSYEKDGFSLHSSDESSIETSEEQKDAHAGVTRISAINDVLTTYGRFSVFGFSIPPLKALLLILVFAQGYAANLDANMSGVPQSWALDEFKQGSLNSTVNTVKGVVAAAIIVPFARISDRIGRMEAWIGAIILFIIGRVACTAAHNFATFIVGIIFTQIGYGGFRFLATALTADVSGLRDRTLFMNIYEMPILINLWISGNIVQSVSKGTAHKWRWDFGIGCISVPATTFLLLIPYAYAQFIANKKKALPPLRFQKEGQSFLGAVYTLILRLDIIGMILFAASLSLVLVPLTLAGGESKKWDKGYIIAMIVVGGVLFFVFAAWEWLFSPAPFIPKKRLERTFYYSLIFEMIWRIAVSNETDYITYVLQVAFNQTPLSTQRLGQFYLFMQCVTSVGVGLILHVWPHPKPFVVGGSLVGLLGMGLMYKYRTAYDGISGFIASDVIVGLGGGMMRFPSWTLVHAAVPHDEMAMVTGFMMSFYQVGASIGSSVGGAVWTQRMPQKLIDILGKTAGTAFYNSPTLFLKKYPMHSKLRDEIMMAYSSVQRLLLIVSLALTALVVILTLGLRSYVVGKRQSFTEEERQKQNARMEASAWARFRTLVGAW